MRVLPGLAFIFASIALVFSGYASADSPNLDYYTHPPGSYWGVMVPGPNEDPEYDIWGLSSAAPTGDGGFVVSTSASWDFAGTLIFRAVLFDLDRNGGVRFVGKYPSPPQEANDTPHYSASCAVPSLQGDGYVLVGFLEAFSFELSPHLWLMKAGSDGSLEWQETFDFGDDDPLRKEWGNCVMELINGYYVAGGYRYNLGPWRGWLFFVGKDADGRPSGDVTTLINTEYPINWMEKTPDGGLILATGDLYSGSIVKLGSDFRVQWDADGHYRSVKPLPDGGYIAVGSKRYWRGRHPSGVPAEEWSKLVVTRFSSGGDVEWTVELGEDEPGSFSRGTSVVRTDDGGFLVVGTTTLGSGSYLWVIKLDGGGNRIWDVAYGKGYESGGYIFRVEDGYMIIGLTNVLGKGRLWLIKLREDFNPRYPYADFTVNPDDPVVDQDVRFDASPSFDPDGMLVSYQWEFGDGSQATGVSAVHAFHAPGTYNVTLKVTDGDGLFKTVTKQVVVSPLKVRWERVIDDTREDAGLGISRAPDGGFVVAGYRWNVFRNYEDLWVFKVDRYGRQVFDEVGNPWGITRYCPEGESGQGWRAAVGFGISPAPGGGYVAVGKLQPGVGNFDAWLLRLDESGNLLWESSFGGDYKDYGFDVYPTQDGYIMAGYTESFASEGHSADAWIVRTDLNGNLQESCIYPGERQRSAFYKVVATSDGGFLAVGADGVSSQGTPDSSQSRTLVVKMDEHLEEVWRVSVFPDYCGFCRWVYEADDGYVVAGTVWRSNEEYAFLAKLRKDDGGVEWSRHYDHKALYNDALGGSVRSGASTPDGGYILVGGIWFPGATGMDGDIWVIKTDSEGNLQWNGVYGEDDRDEMGFGVVVEKSSRYVVLGTKSSVDNTDVWLFEIGKAVGELSVGLSTAGAIHAGNVPFTVYFEPRISGGFPPYTYDLDFDGDGTWDEVGIPGQIREYYYTYERPGRYRPRIRVRDSAGNVAEGTMEVYLEVYGSPVADFDARPASGQAPLEVFFNLRKIASSPGLSISWWLDVDGDGNFDIANKPTWEPIWWYDSPGTYTVTLKVEDELGRVSQITREDYIAVAGMVPESEGVQVNHSHVTSDPLDDPEFFNDLGNAPGDVDLETARGFTVDAEGPDGCYNFLVAFDEPITRDYTLYKLPDWEEVDYTYVDSHTVRVTLCIRDGILDPRFVLAEPVPIYTLTIEARGDGTTDPPPGTYQYQRGSTVHVEATPSAGEEFVVWEGDASGSFPSVDLTMDGDRTVVAVFTVNRNHPPSVSDPDPESGASDVSTSPDLSVSVNDDDGDQLTVTFHDGSSGEVIGTVDGVQSGSRASCVWPSLEHDTTYSWYVEVDDGVNPPVRSPMWSFTTSPLPGDVNGDGLLDAVDFLITARFLLGLPNPPGFDSRRMDMDGTGIIDMGDTLFMGEAALGVFSPFWRALAGAGQQSSHPLAPGADSGIFSYVG